MTSKQSIALAVALDMLEQLAENLETAPARATARGAEYPDEGLAGLLGRMSARTGVLESAVEVNAKTARGLVEYLRTSFPNAKVPG